MQQTVESWGRYPRLSAEVRPLYWRHLPIRLPGPATSVLPFGLGRSYGDSCLNGGNVLLATRGLNRFIAFDRDRGVLRCEAGVSLAEILDLIVPHGWFLPVTPGTKFVTVGGAIANDVHGKNHHVAGAFGNHVVQFELLRSDGQRSLCSAESNADLFQATIGGLGLTGLVLWAEFQLKRISGRQLLVNSVKFSGLEEFFHLTAQYETSHEYVVAWLDCIGQNRAFGRGILMGGNHDSAPCSKPRHTRAVAVPCDFPEFTLNPWVVKAFTWLLYHKQLRQVKTAIVDYDPFFYPLDAVLRWNRVYGRRGLLQWQCVIPMGDHYRIMSNILRRITDSKLASFLAVLKIMGGTRSLGLLSFSRPGVTLAVDFPARPEVFLLLEVLDSIVVEAGGALYPAKDARMSPACFQACYPQWRQLQKHMDPAFNSSFWRRVTA